MMSQEVASQNPLDVEFTGTNVASALFKTFSESVVLNNGTTLTRGDALKTFLDNMSYMAPERYANVFWHGNKYGTPYKCGVELYIIVIFLLQMLRDLYSIRFVLIINGKKLMRMDVDLIKKLLLLLIKNSSV